jgi:outer membrane protein TolC
MNTLASLALAALLAQAPGEISSGRPDPDAVSAPTRGAPAPAANVIALDEALRLAAERNLDLRAAAARLREAEQGTWKAWAGYLPSVTAGATYTRNDREVVFPLTVNGETMDVPFQRLETIGAQVEANQVIFSPALVFGIRSASRGEDVAELNTEEVRRDILFGTAQAYYGVASLRQAAQVSERLLEIAARQEKDARVRYQAGAIAKVGLLRPEIDRARAEQDLRRARNSYESARIALATLLDRPVDFEVEDPPEPQLPGDGAQLEAAALRDRADVQAARRSVEAAEAGRNAQRSRYLPTLAGFGRRVWQNEAGLTGQKDSWAVGVSLQWRILDGGLREAEIREANARVDEAEASAASAEAKARAEVRQALLDLESARANAEKAREQRELAAENQRLIDVSFRAGAATAIEQADATAVLRNAEIAQTTETLGAQLAALRVLKVAGSSLR